MVLTIVVPTYNERDNIALLLEQLDRLLESLAGQYEIIVVDDASQDCTALVVSDYAAQHVAVRLINRHAQRDLSASLVDGFDAAKGEYLIAMDADGQHDPALVLTLLGIAKNSCVDLVVATRYADGGNSVGWNCIRRVFSRIATRVSSFVLGTTISDPLSGYFLLRREKWQQLRLHVHPMGFKLLQEIIATANDLRYAEAGYRFSERQRGRSKLSAAVVLVFVVSLLRLCWRRFTGWCR